MIQVNAIHSLHKLRAFWGQLFRMRNKGPAIVMHV